MELHEHYCCDGKMVFKGSWTPHEDELLNHYMKAHGHHRPPWKAVPKYAGLLRCGKSCRFRWLHYLRPTLNREKFTKEEIQLIYDMQRTIGNKWAEIAKFLPGRSDNSIKNFSNKHSKKKLIKKNKNPTSPLVDLYSQPIFTSPENNFSSKDENFVGHMNGTGVHTHGDSVYDLITLNNNSPTYMMPPPITNQQILQHDHTLSTDNNLTLLHNDKLFPSLFFYTSPINHQNNFQNDNSSYIYYDLPPLPDAFLSQIDNTVSLPTCEISTKSTYYQSLYNGENSSGWMCPSSSYNQVPEKYQYDETNYLYDPYLLVSQDPTQLMADPIFGVTSSELNNHNMMIRSECLN